MTNDTKQRTITLTGRPPVRIVEDAWPTIAQIDGSDAEVAGDDPSVADAYGTSWTIRVRRHADGRAIVYGTHTRAEGERDHGGLWAAGEIVDAPSDDAALAAAIERAGQALGVPPAYVQGCIARLPAEDLS